MAPKATLPSCIFCKKQIEPDTEYTIGDHDEAFHDECFKCEHCGERIEGAFVVLTDDGEQRKFKHQTGHYFHPDCAKKAAGSKVGQEKKTGTAVGKLCIICKQPLTNEMGGIEMVDGTNLHFECFKCKECGKVQDISDKVNMRLLRTKIAQLKKGEYVCDVCNPGPNKDAAPKNEAFHAGLEEAKKQAAKQKEEDDAKKAAQEAKMAAAVAAQEAQQAAFKQAQADEAAAKDAAQSSKEQKLEGSGEWTLDQLKDKARCAEYHVHELKGKKNEFLLNDAEFQSAFGMDKASWENVAQWKKDAAKKKLGIF